jgi:hypothetical protein
MLIDDGLVGLLMGGHICIDGYASEYP